jgi:LacI family transcriptional regulator
MEKRKRVTLKDIANKTGFTINTVSRALKDKNDISDETKEIIRKTALDLHYVEDAAASSLRSGSTKTIAVIIGDISNPFFGVLVRNIDLEVKDFGYTLIIFNTNEDSMLESSAILSAYSKRVDGIIICPVQENTDNIRLLQRLAIPFVLIGRYFKGLKNDAVVWDDVKAGELAADFLIQQGHVNILFIGGPLHVSSGWERLEGYRQAHLKAGIPVKDSLVRISPITAGACKEIIEKVLKEQIPFTGLVAFSDLMAYEILCALRTSGNKNYRYTSVVGFDNIQGKLMLPVSVPSIDSRQEEAKICVDMLIRRIGDPSKGEPELVILDVEMKIPANVG